jgi:hypothetical protein
MNKKLTTLFTGLTLIAGSSIFAQTQKVKQHQHKENSPAHRTCGTMENYEFLKATRPNYEKEVIEYNNMLEAYIKKEQHNTQRTAAPIIVPVVIHILYQNATENISDLRATEQVTVLNEDFQKQNADTTLIPALFKPLAGSMDVEFVLAQRDPNGNPTNGIVHKATTVATFSTNNAVKSNAQGGDDAWDVSRYVNIWVCDLGNSLLGYGEFPAGSLSNTWGLVLNYRYTGKTGATAPFNKGRTGTHEFGHCFNLRHIWADEPNCAQDDNVTDTPQQKGENYGIPTFPQGTGATGGCCSAAATSSMFMNFMDYTDDAGMQMFSIGQSTRMNAVLNTAPYNILQSSNGHIPVVLVANDASIFNVTSPTGTLCAGPINPVATFKNTGSTTLTSCTINYNIDGGTNSTMPWTGSLASLATTTINLPPIIVTAGTHTLNVFTSNPNGATDGDPSNDQSSSTFTAIASSGGVAIPFSEGFESTTFVPVGWTLSNPDNADTWGRTTAAKKTGLASAKLDNFTNPFAGESDAMITPALNLSAQPSPSLTFQVAYKLYTSPTANPNYSDTLDVSISTDCGATYTSLYKKFGTALTTTTPTFGTASFVPTNTQWRLETVSLAAYASAQNAYIKFTNISGYEQNLYIDDINIAGIVGLNNQTTSTVLVNVYPNPNSGQLTVEVANHQGNAVGEISIYNVIGQKVLNTIPFKGLSTIQSIDMSSLANGVYQVEVKSNGTSTFKKVVLNK